MSTLSSNRLGAHLAVHVQCIDNVRACEACTLGNLCSKLFKDFTFRKQRDWELPVSEHDLLIS